MSNTDPALAGLSDPRLARKPAQSRTPAQERERVLIVQVDFGKLDLEEAVQEVRMLAESAGADVVDVITCRRDRPDVALFVGSGKAEEIGRHAKALDAGLVIFNHGLSPVQQRNLEQGSHSRNREIRSRQSPRESWQKTSHRSSQVRLISSEDLG